MAVGRKVAGLLFLAAAVYGLFLRRWLFHWGASAEELARTYPGAELVPDGTRAATMAVTIEAPPAQVWPWLVQMGWDRAGSVLLGSPRQRRPPQCPRHPPRVAAPRRWRLPDSLVTRRPHYERLGGSSARTKSVLRVARLERSAWPHTRPDATTAVGLHRRPLGLPSRRATS